MGRLMRRRARIGVSALAAAALVGCAAAPRPLYHWGSFPSRQYQVLLHEGASAQEQIQALEAEAEKARASQAALPPGFRAHLGLMYLEQGDADRARDAWTAEKTAFPESAPYMDRLLKQLDRRAEPSPRTASPA